ncbi:MAG: peptidoglycan bridge formation glycyltransferase FemA/FemB family protein [Candidatus Melainabacteria bacterium]|nr:MAG: peptidoglycan bridge formation glycyltransferase FemA/FemB family protein [Candidatus Melainabacteria bacterium]
MSLQAKSLGLLDSNCELALAWERLVKQNPSAGIMQSLNWACMKRAQGLNSVHVGLFDNETLVGGAIFYLAQEAQSRGTGMMVAPEGPVIDWLDKQKSALQLRALAGFAQKFARSNGIMSMRVEPRLPLPLPAVLREFGRAPYDLVPRDTLYVDIDKDENDILMAMKSKGRYNIKLSQKHNVKLSSFGHFNFDAANSFYEAVNQASVRDGFALEPKPFFDNMIAHLCEKGLATVLLAHHEDELLGGLLLTHYGERATYLYGGVTNAKRQMMGGYALQWAAMKKAKEQGCKNYDFYGYVPHRSPEHRYSRFSQFKSQFGGRPFRFIGAQDYMFLDNIAEVFIKAAQEVEGRKTEVQVGAEKTRFIAGFNF